MTRRKRRHTPTIAQQLDATLRELRRNRQAVRSVDRQQKRASRDAQGWQKREPVIAVGTRGSRQPALEGINTKAVRSPAMRVMDPVNHGQDKPTKWEPRS